MYPKTIYTHILLEWMTIRVLIDSSHPPWSYTKQWSRYYKSFKCWVIKKNKKKKFNHGINDCNTKNNKVFYSTFVFRFRLRLLKAWSRPIKWNSLQRVYFFQFLYIRSFNCFAVTLNHVLSYLIHSFPPSFLFCCRLSYLRHDIFTFNP